MFALVGRIGAPKRVFIVSCGESIAAKTVGIEEKKEVLVAATTVLRRSRDRTLRLHEASEFARQPCGGIIGPELDGTRNFALV
jgi:hypothetical protein